MSPTADLRLVRPCGRPLAGTFARPFARPLVHAGLLALALAATLPVQAVRPAVASTLPQPVELVKVEYPEGAELGWNEGEVRLAFVVDEAGRIRDVQVERGAHPAYVDASLDALLRSSYRPGTRAGQPLAMGVKRSYQFRLSPMGEELISPGQEPLIKPATGIHLGLVPGLQVALWPVYPAALLRNHVNGNAWARFQVAADGTVHGVTVLGASHPDFGRALQAQLLAWRFEPGKARGPIEYAQRFSAAQTAETGVPRSARALLDGLLGGKAQVAGAGQLDGGVLVPVRRVEPVAPAGLRTRSGVQAVVDFHFDADGRVLMPELASATQEDWGWAALTAVNAWRFEPPRRNGQPVVARGQVTLKLDATP